MASYDRLPETEIIRRILAGEKALYEIIVRRFNATLYKIGRSYHFDHADTQDLMQDTFVDAYRYLARFEGRAAFKTWLIRIMLNNCYHRKEKASFKQENRQELNETSMSPHTNDPHRLAQNRELGSVIERALMALPFDYRITFSLREINGLNVSETAEMLDISEANVKVRLNRAKTMLRKEIEKSYTASELFEFNLVYCDAMVQKVMEEIDALP